MLLHNPADKKDACKNSSQCLRAPVKGRKMQKSEESFGCLGTAGIAVPVTDSGSFVPELHTPSSVCLQVSTPVPNICARCC